MDEIVGFVNGNLIRGKVLNLLSSQKSVDPERIAKVLRIIPSIADKTLSELEEKDLIKLNDGKYELTELGNQIVDYIKRVS
ncbi:MAG: transcriptional regulator [Methanosarcinaceae archaeon]|mgnify:CR=1 FL=1|nr:transcriptional regulator [Methanosarcinaceae archaeon]